MLRRIVAFLLAASLACSLSSVNAQLFKRAAERRAQRQNSGQNFSGGSNSRQDRPGLFDRARERREMRETQQNIPQYGNNSRASGQNEKTGGLFWRAKQRKEERRESGGGLFNKRSDQDQPRSYVHNNSYSRPQSATTYVRTTQRASASTSLFTKTATQPATLNTPQTITRPQPTQVQPGNTKSALPSIVAASAERPRAQRPESKSVVSDVSSAERSPGSRRTRTSPTAGNRPPLRDTSDDNPVARPTGNLPELSQPSVEANPGVLA